MAQLSSNGDELILTLSPTERMESLHGDLRVPRSAVLSVEVLDDAHRAADIMGFRVGTRLPGIVEVASVHGVNKSIFAAVHHDTPRGLRIVLSGAAQNEWIVGCPDPEAVAASITKTA